MVSIIQNIIISNLSHRCDGLFQQFIRDYNHNIHNPFRPSFDYRRRCTSAERYDRTGCVHNPFRRREQSGVLCVLQTAQSATGGILPSDLSCYCGSTVRDTGDARVHCKETRSRRMVGRIHV